jgi:hypothetical protein
MADIQELIQKLNSFQTRKSAKPQLIQAGEECVEDLSKALTGPMRDNVKWNVIDILAHIGSSKALPALRACAEDPTFESVCQEAIFTITGEPVAPPAEEEPAPKDTDTPPAEETPEETTPADTPPADAPALSDVPRAIPPPPTPHKTEDKITRVAVKIKTQVAIRCACIVTRRMPSKPQGLVIIMS